jgi:RNA polymerase sigma-70 factor (ECF subfamily)
LIRGAFHRTDPARGRFRDYVKTVLFHLVARHRKAPPSRTLDDREIEALAAPEAEQTAFDEAWRDVLLERTWMALADAHKTWHDVLRFRAAHPALSSAEMARKLGQELGQPLTPNGVRQLLHRAREKFANLLIDEVIHSLKNPTVERLEQELEELGLLTYCGPALERYRSS